ncbi:Eukaryotic translation initiation factor 3 subunit I [Plecturocebus cupreus]
MYNHERDLFTVAKEPFMNACYSVNGERLSTYMGHTRAVWYVDADWDTNFDFGGNIITISTEKQMSYQCFVSLFDRRDLSQADNNESYMQIPCSDSKITSAICGPLGECIIAGHESGELNQVWRVVGEC